MTFLDFKKINYLFHSINCAGGGGNLDELEELALILKKESLRIPLKKIKEFNDEDYIVGYGRIGRPGVRGDLIRNLEDAPLKAVEHLLSFQGVSFSKLKGFFPIEAVAGQFARAGRAFLTLQKKYHSLSMVDADLGGGRAVPDFFLIINVEKVAEYPFCVILVTERKNKLFFRYKIIKEKDPYILGKKLRKTATQSKIGVSWTAGPLMKVKEAKKILAQNTLSNAIEQGRKLFLTKKAGKEILKAKIVEIRKEEIPGFPQSLIVLEDKKKEKYFLAWRNEFVILYKKNQILVKPPRIICLIDVFKNIPIQGNFLKKGMKVRVVVADPIFVIKNPQKRKEWLNQWRVYFEKEKRKGYWHFPLF